MWRWMTAMPGRSARATTARCLSMAAGSMRKAPRMPSATWTRPGARGWKRAWPAGMSSTPVAKRRALMRPDLQLRQFTREALFLGGDAVILRDTIAADAPHHFEWLLQTDAPPSACGHGSFSVASGATTCRIHALQPDRVAHQVYEQEIKANPTSAKPDWIISNTQYALALCPTAPSKDCSFLVALDLAGFEVESRQAERGLAARMSSHDRNGGLGSPAAKMASWRRG